MPVPAGAVTVSEVPVAAMPVPGAEPNSTDVVPARPVPVTVTTVPPLLGPAEGEMPVTVAGAL